MRALSRMGSTEAVAGNFEVLEVGNFEVLEAGNFGALPLTAWEVQEGCNHAKKLPESVVAAGGNLPAQAAGVGIPGNLTPLESVVGTHAIRTAPKEAAGSLARRVEAPVDGSSSEARRVPAAGIPGTPPAQEATAPVAPPAAAGAERHSAVAARSGEDKAVHFLEQAGVLILALGVVLFPARAEVPFPAQAVVLFPAQAAANCRGMRGVRKSLAGRRRAQGAAPRRGSTGGLSKGRAAVVELSPEAGAGLVEGEEAAARTLCRTGSLC